MAQNPIRPTDDEARLLAKKLLRTARSAALGTSEDGHPSVSLTAMATAFDGTPVILVSKLSSHTGNLLADPRASLLLTQGGKGDPLAHPRMTVMAMAAFLEREQAEASGIRRRFLAQNPKAELYVDFPDFAFVTLSIRRASLNGGFGKAYELSAKDVLSNADDAEALREAEEGAIAHMNADHADAISLYATRLCQMPPGPWRATTLDPDGMVLQTSELSARLSFETRITAPGELRKALKLLADKARASAAEQSSEGC